MDKYETANFIRDIWWYGSIAWILFIGWLTLYTKDRYSPSVSYIAGIALGPPAAGLVVVIIVHVSVFYLF